MRYLLIFSLLFSCAAAKAQYTFHATLKDSLTNIVLPGASAFSASASSPNTISDSAGNFIFHFPAPGSYQIEFTASGHREISFTATVPDSTIHVVLLATDDQTLENVIVIASTRTGEPIETAATKVEVLGKEELGEESTLKPGNIASILGDVSGVQIQQSSAVSGNSNIRIQGLDGRYTQVLRDGMPLYGGYAGGFGVLSVAPLDLQQVELIKGSSSTLYGGGAIGGLVNLISKKPSYQPEASFLVNTSTLKETNLNAYYAQRNKTAGFTFFAGQTFQGAVDVNKDGFSDVAKYSGTMIHPTLFIYPSAKTSLSVGWSGSFDNRLGGDMVAVTDHPNTSHPYFEKNILNRNIFSVLFNTKVDNSLSFSVKSSISQLGRTETTDSYLFKAQQLNYYSEISFLKKKNKHILTGGINITGSRFSPSKATPVPLSVFSNNSAGIFIQDTWQLLHNTKIETGLRADHHQQYGNFILPRIALFRKLDEHWGTRAGFSMGYVTPDPLTPQLIDNNIYKIMPVAAGTVAERSYAGNAEVNYKHKVGTEGEFFINNAFFITSIEHPVTGDADLNGNIYFTNRDQPLITKGIDTYVQLHIPDWEFYAGYTYTDAERTYLPAEKFVPVTPRHRAAATVVYEMEGFRAGLEASYNGSQYRYEDHSRTPGYLFMAAMMQKKFGLKWSLVVNCENLFDERQSKYESLFTGSPLNPSFKALWAPIDGRIINFCLRFEPFATDK